MLQTGSKIMAKVDKTAAKTVDTTTDSIFVGIPASGTPDGLKPTCFFLKFFCYR